jgi:hypothetical protein
MTIDHYVVARVVCERIFEEISKTTDKITRGKMVLLNEGSHSRFQIRVKSQLLPAVTHVMTYYMLALCMVLTTRRLPAKPEAQTS